MTNYRPEIDGLRALAVLSVIFFHAGFQSFSGGFVGVDIFFVISGYLITSIILSEKQNDTFTLIGFYERRMRRILPALFLVMFVCLPLAWLCLRPNEMKEFCDSLIAVSVFASNYLFWTQSGYFATANELKPLLHTWSLAVEEQYYLLFPLFLLFTWSLGKRLVISILVITALTSLSVSHWGAFNKPGVTFYFLPTRGWELLIGVLASFYLFDNKKIEINKFLNEVFSFIGLALIIFSVFNFDLSTPFPSLYALIPTLGTVLIILFASQQTYICKLLSNKLMVGIGLISYSAYLWHQPLFAYARQVNYGELDNASLLTLTVLVMVLSYFSWRYIENDWLINKITNS